MDGWEKKASKFLQIPSGRAINPLAQTRVQFHQDQTHLLVVHETQIAIYEASKLECVKQVCKTYLVYLVLCFLVGYNNVVSYVYLANILLLHGGR